MSWRACCKRVLKQRLLVRQNLVGLVPLALVLGELTEDLAIRFGDVVGGLLVRTAAVPVHPGPLYTWGFMHLAPVCDSMADCLQPAAPCR